MALKIKAKEKKLKFSKDGPEVYRYVMVPDLYSTLDQDKVIKEAAIRSRASARSSLQAMLPVWELAAFAPAAVRPDFTMITGLVIRDITLSKR